MIRKAQTYGYLLLQQGTLPLSPDGAWDLSKEHKCSSVLLWPSDDTPCSQNMLLTDPCFTVNGFVDARRQLEKYHLLFSDIRHMFITHAHYDHLPYVPAPRQHRLSRLWMQNLPAGLQIIPCPGHASDLQSLVFQNSHQETIWITGDAILNLQWLRRWKYYWPNMYQPDDIVQTWESLARILTSADIVIPGHGAPISVTSSLLQDLLTSFSSAEYAERCSYVRTTLHTRLKQLLSREIS